MNDQKKFVLSLLRVASLSTRTYSNEADSIGVALSAGFITPTQAVEWAIASHIDRFFDPRVSEHLHDMIAEAA